MSYYSLTTNLHCRARFSYNCNKVSALSVYLKLKEKVKIMGNKKFNLTKLALAMGVTLGLSGCFSDNDNNVEIKPPVPEPEDKVVIQQPPASVEKQAGSLSILVTDHLGQILAEDVAATITFKSEEGLLDAAGEAIDTDDKTSTGSSFSFTVAEVPEAGVSYTFTVDAENYLSNTGTLTINSENSTTEIELRLTPESTEATDVAVVAETKTLAETAGDVEVEYDKDAGLTIGDGSADAKITLTQAIPAEKVETAVGSVAVSIKQGTKFLDDNGDALEEAPTLTVAYFANEATRSESDNGSSDEAAESVTESSSLDAFPGGLNLTLAAPSEGEEDEVGSFTSGGFVAIELKAGDQSVSTFGKDENGDPIKLEVAMQVDRKTANPCPVSYTGDIKEIAVFAEANGFKNGVCTLENATSRPVEANDIFPVWSYEETTGEWSFESYGQVNENTNSQTVFDVIVEVEHLSYWNLDFFTRAIRSPKCPGGRLDFNIEDANGEASSLAGDIIIEANGYRNVIRSFYNTDRSKGTFYSPPSFPVTLKFAVNGQNVTAGIKGTDNANLAVVGSGTQARTLTFDNMCEQLAGETLVLTVEPPTIIEQPVATRFVCEADSTVTAGQEAAPVSTAAQVQVFRNGKLTNAAYSAGTVNFPLEEGVEYTVRGQNPETNVWTPQVELTPSTTAFNIDFTKSCNTQTVTGSGGS
jgi:hypothetical protein